MNICVLCEKLILGIIKGNRKELNNFIAGAYLGVAKEFRVKKGLHVHIAYQHHINSKILSKDEISYNYVDENISGKVDAYNNLARSFLMLGLKFYLKKKLRIKFFKIKLNATFFHLL